MNKENLEQGLTKLLKTFYTKKYNSSAFRFDGVDV